MCQSQQTIALVVKNIIINLVIPWYILFFTYLIVLSFLDNIYVKQSLNNTDDLLKNLSFEHV
jgi:hypothetical protein